MTPPAARLPSLRRRMLWQLMLPLALVWLLGSAVAVGVAYIYTRKAFDRSLVDDAYAIAANVTLRDGALAFNLSPQEVGAVLFDRDEKVFFAVLRADGTLLSGQGGLHAEPLDPAEPVLFDDLHYHGFELRRVTVQRGVPLAHTVIVAQTTRSRTRLVEQMLLASIPLQAALLLALGLWLRRSVARELQPLNALEEALARRDTSDLTPVQLQPRTRDIALLTEAFNGLMGRIDAGVQAQREFAGNVAHELRTPLAGIRSLATYGLAQTQPEVWLEQLRRIVASEQRASHLVDQLLALALADEARQNLKLEPLRIDLLVQELLLRLLPRADALGVDLGAEGLEQPRWVMGSAPLLEGLLSNLVDNALRYGRPLQGGEPPRVTVTVQGGQGSSIILSVSDNGPGISDAERVRVLARWEQGPAGLQRGEGAGLGLAIVARYAALLGSELTLKPATVQGPRPGGLWAGVVLQGAAPPQ